MMDLFSNIGTLRSVALTNERGNRELATAPTRRADYHAYRARLIEAARELIAERGPEGLSVSEVARRAGVNRSTAHAHFGTRDELVAAVKRAYQRPAVEILARHGSLDDWLENVVGQLESVPGMSRLLIHDLLDGAGPNPEGWAKYTEWIRDIARDHGSEGGPDPDFIVLMLTAVNMLWPILAEMHYDESELPRAKAELPDQVRRLLTRGFVDRLSSDAKPDKGEPNESQPDVAESGGE
jgi:AcrR family transcriptional regulator